MGVEKGRRIRVGKKQGWGRGKSTCERYFRGGLLHRL